MPRRKTTTKRARRRRHPKSAKVVRLVHGRVALRVAGYSGVHKLAPSQLIKFVPITKLRAAAKRVLRASGVHKTRKTHKKRKSYKRSKRRGGLRAHRRLV